LVNASRRADHLAGDSVAAIGTAIRSAQFVEHRNRVAQFAWSVASLACFVAIWELAWAFGLLDPRVLPPPHLFLRDFAEQAKFFGSTAQAGEDVQSAGYSLFSAILGTTLRVVVGLTIGFVAALVTGVAIRYFRLVGKLMLPTIRMLAPISPLAWLPVAIFVFGVGNGPAFFMVSIAVFFMILLATVHQIDNVPHNYIHVARIMGATRFQIYRNVILPTILPGLFVILRMNLFGAWMVVLIAEAVGVGSGLGQVVMLARNTFNFTLVCFTMTLIGALGFLFDFCLRQIQSRVLYWVPNGPRQVAG
jgi:NitT/TauT family transport system permease protein